MITISLNQLETQALGSIADGLAGSDPRLASMLTIFSRLACPSPSITRMPTRANADAPRAIAMSMNAKGAGRG